MGVGGRGILELQEFFFVVKILVLIFLGHCMNIFRINWRARNVFIEFSLAQIFLLYFARPHKFSNGPSLGITLKLIPPPRD